MEKLVNLSVRRRGVVVAVWIAVFCVSLGALGKMSIDAVPDVTNTQVSILTSAPGLSPLEVEQYLTFPVEMAMNGVPGLDEIRSVSRTAVSAVTIIFRDGTEPWLARQLVSERLKLAESDIPPGYGRPELGPVSTGLGEIFEFYLTSKTHTPMELRTLLDWEVAFRLRAVPGVVEVNGMGGEVKQYQVVVDAKRLAAYRLALGDIQRILERNNAAIGGGYIEKNRESFVIRGDAQYQTLEDIEDTVITSDADGTPVLIKNVARVQSGAALRRRHKARRGRDRRRHGDDAHGRELARRRHGRQGAARRDPAQPARGRRDPLVLRPRRVHRAHAAHRLRQPRR